MPVMPDDDGWQKRRRFRRNKPLIIASVIALAVVGTVCYGLTLGDKSDDSNFGTQPYATATHPNGVYATTTATADPNGPFAGTPAAKWPIGAAGITVPAAVAVTGFTKAQVATDLNTVRKLLTDARLDPRMLVNHDASAFLALIAPDERSDLKAMFTKPSTDGGAITSLATLLDGTVKLDSYGPRVSGRITFAAARDNHNDLNVLQIITNYVWAYSFVGHDDNVVVLHDEIHWWFYRSADVDNVDLGAWPSTFQGYGQDIDCADFNQGLVAPPLSDQGSGPDLGANDPNQFYDPDHSLDITNTCDTSSSASPTP